MEYKKEIVFLDRVGKHIILMPVFYEHEYKPAWKNVFSGTLEECKNAFSSFPDSLQATEEENKKNRHYKRLEADFLQSIGHYKAAEAIRKNYNL